MIHIRAMGAALVLLVGCATALVPIQPELSYLSTREGEATLVKLEGVEALSDFRGLLVHGYPAEGPRAVVVFVHGLGTNARIWDLPEVGGLARRVWRSGYGVYTVDMVGLEDEASAEAPYKVRKNRLGQLLSILSKRHPGVPLLGVGHDIGGTLLYHLASETGSPLAGVVGLSAPVAFGGYSKAVTQLLNAPAELGRATLHWPELDSLGGSQRLANEATLTELLLTTELPSRERRLFFTQALEPMSRSFLESIARRGHQKHVPTLDPVFRGERRHIPILAIMAPSDGLAPPWQCDWKGLGVNDVQIERLFLTRSNGNAIEYNHLDMVLHPRASREVHPKIMDWIESQTGR